MNNAQVIERIQDLRAHPDDHIPLTPSEFDFYLVFICLGMKIHEHEFEAKGGKT